MGVDVAVGQSLLVEVVEPVGSGGDPDADTVGVGVVGGEVGTGVPVPELVAVKLLLIVGVIDGVGLVVAVPLLLLLTLPLDHTTRILGGRGGRPQR